MEIKKLFDFIGTLILAIGFFLAFLPHAVHVTVGFNEKTSHTKHIIVGIALVVIALGILILNNNAMKLQLKR